MAPKAPKAAPEATESATKATEAVGRLDLKNQAGTFIESAFDKMESIGISREMALDIFEGFFGDEKTGFIANLFLPFYEKERAKDLKKDFDEALGKDEYEFTDKEMVTIYEAWKKDENFKTKTIVEYLKNLTKEAKALKEERGDKKWNIKNIDVSGELQKDQLEKLKEEVNRDIQVVNADFDSLVKGAATGEYNSDEVKQAAEQSINRKGDKITDTQKKSLMEIIIGKTIGKDLIKTACLNALRIKINPEASIKVVNENKLIINNLEKLKSPIECEYDNDWKITYKRESAILKDKNNLEFFLSEIGKKDGMDVTKIKEFLEEGSEKFLKEIGIEKEAKDFSEETISTEVDKA